MRFQQTPLIQHYRCVSCSPRSHSGAGAAVRWLSSVSGYKTRLVLSMQEGKSGILCIPAVCPSSVGSGRASPSHRPLRVQKMFPLCAGIEQIYPSLPPSFCGQKQSVSNRSRTANSGAKGAFQGRDKHRSGAARTGRAVTPCGRTGAGRQGQLRAFALCAGADTSLHPPHPRRSRACYAGRLPTQSGCYVMMGRKTLPLYPQSQMQTAEVSVANPAFENKVRELKSPGQTGKPSPALGWLRPWTPPPLQEPRF